MEALQSVWTSLVTPNEGLSAIIFNDFGIPFIFIEMTVNMLLFTVALNIKYNKKQYFTYVLLCFLFFSTSNLLLSKPYSSYINMIIYPFIIFFVFKTTPLKSILAELLPVIISSPLEVVLVRIFVLIFNITYELVYSIPLLRIVIALFIYICTFIIYLIIKKYKGSVFASDLMSKHNRVIIFSNSVIGIITIWTQFYLIGYYNDNLPLNIILLSLLTLFAYFFVSIFSLFKTLKLEITSQNLAQVQDYNNTLKVLYDDIRTFRHDFGNIVQAIGGYVETEDISGLKEYYKQLQSDFEEVKNLEILNPNVIDNPAVYSLITSKYHKANELGIKMQININLKIKDLNMKIYEFSRILGILLDNSIEACQNCDEKIINFEIARDMKAPRQLLLIQNTYSNKNIDLNKINEKGYSSKEVKDKPHGLGLWEVQKIIKHSKNLNLYTTKDSIFFTQQLELYDI